MFSFGQTRSHDTIRIQKKLLGNLELFQKHPELINKDKYTITSDVDPAVVDLFFSRLGGDTSELVTTENAEQLRELCNELGFSGFNDELRTILGSDVEQKMRKDFLGLRGRIDRHDVIIEELQRRVIELERQLQKHLNVPDRVETVERCVEEIRRNEMERARAADVTVLSNEVERLKQADQALRDELRRNNVQGAIAQAKREADTLREDVQRLRSEVSAKASTADVTVLSKEVERLKQADQALRDELSRNNVIAQVKREMDILRKNIPRLPSWGSELDVAVQKLQFKTGELESQVKGLDEKITVLRKYSHNEFMKLYEMFEGKWLKKAIQKALKDAGIEERLEALENGEAGGGTDLREH